jgi:hypothetical protein
MRRAASRPLRRVGRRHSHVDDGEVRALARRGPRGRNVVGLADDLEARAARRREGLAQEDGIVGEDDRIRSAGALKGCVSGSRRGRILRRSVEEAD